MHSIAASSGLRCEGVESVERDIWDLELLPIDVENERGHLVHHERLSREEIELLSCSEDVVEERLVCGQVSIFIMREILLLVLHLLFGQWDALARATKHLNHLGQRVPIKVSLVELNRLVLSVWVILECQLQIIKA